MIEPGQMLGGERYRVVRVLGEGSQATTYEAVDAKEGCLVAVKRFVVKGASSWKEVELAEREAAVLRTLEHPLVPRFVDNFEEGGALYLVTKLVEGSSLAQGTKRLGKEEVASLVADLADAIHYLHGRAPPVIHRDIKPANVIRRTDGRFCLVDFGAVRAKLAQSGGSTVVGTFGFMAPEQFQGRAMPQSDVYAVGATAITMLTGEQPENLPHRGLAIDVAAALGHGADPKWVEALTSMLEPDPEKRPASLEAIVRKLKSGSASSNPAAAPEPAPKRPTPAGGPSPFGRRDFTPPFERMRGRRSHGPPELGPPALFLAIARIAVLVHVVWMVPILLACLSLVFGRPLRRAAARVRDAGYRAIRRIDRARAHVSGAPVPPVEEAESRERVRVGASERRVAEVDVDAAVDVDDADAVAEAEAQAVEDARGSKRKRRR